MANAALNAVLLWQNHEVTTPNLPFTPPTKAAPVVAEPVPAETEKKRKKEEEDDEDEEEDDDDGEKHQ